MATDAGLTAYHAIMAVGGAKEGMRVGVIGLGGLGYIGARVAVLAGADPSPAPRRTLRTSTP
jgi:propanol-preferring alcohol dehydrogenase